MASWAVAAATSKHEVAFETLTRLQVVAPAAHPPGEPAYQLNKSFQQCLQEAMCCGLSSQLREVPQDAQALAPTKAELDAYADSQWEVGQVV